MKIYTRVVIDMKTNEVLEEESFEYEGELALCGGGKGGGGGGGKTTTTTVPWSAQQPYLTYGFQEARNLYDQGGANIIPQVAAPFSEAQQQALQGIIDQASAGTPSTAAAQDAYLGLLNQGAGANPAIGYLTPTASGQYLDPENNPYFRQSMENALGLAKVNLQSKFAQAGRTGSALASDTAARALGDMSTQAYAQQYNQAAQNQLQAAGLLGNLYDTGTQRQLQAIAYAPAMQELAYADLNKLLGAGGMQQAQTQNELNAALAAYNQQQMQPYQNLEW
jgi:hypothetical protein